MTKMLKVWSQIAKTSMNSSAGEEYKLFNDSKFVCERITEIVLKYYFKDEQFRFFVCKDEELDQIQAIAVIQNNQSNVNSPVLNIVYMATHPHNLRCSLNKNIKSRVVGSGKALIEHIVDVCKEERKSKIALTSLLTSQEFYYKMNFKLDKTGNPEAVNFYLEIDS